MNIVPVQENEQEKLNNYSAANSVQEADFDDICHIVSGLCHFPVTLISIIGSERKWFRSGHPLTTAAATAEFAFCDQALHHPHDAIIISDLHKDYRFRNMQLVKEEPYVAFYAGIPLIGQEGTVLGALCIWDHKPRELDPKQLAALQSLVRQTALLIDLKIKNGQLAQKIEESKTAYTDLENFTTIAAHDLKSPLNAMISLTDLLKNNYSGKLDEEGNEYINYIHNSALIFTDLITAVFNYSRSTHLLSEQREEINFTRLIEEIIGVLKAQDKATLSFDRKDKMIMANRVALKQILLNMMDNALKYNNKETINIELLLHETPLQYTIEIKDNGVGIPEEERAQIFELFRRLPDHENDGKDRGIGLAIVKKLIEKIGGDIKVESEVSKGTTFIVSLPK